MVNQQLQDYVNEQLKVGVSKEAIRGALIEAGWQEKDVNEAMRIVPAVRPMVDAVKPMAPAIKVSSPGSVSSLNISAVKASASPITVAKSVEPMSFGSSSFNAIGFSAPMAKTPGGGKHRLVDIVMGLLILVLAATATAFFIQNMNLTKQGTIFQTDRDAALSSASDLRQQLEKIRGDMDVLRADNRDLTEQMSIFASTQASGVEQIDVQGMLVGPATASGLFTLQTSKGIMLSLKNSRDANVSKLLEPYLNKVLAITGMHAVGSKEITITAINGTEVVAPTGSAATGTVFH
ncbi:MAG: hypothetical protein V1489_00035 [Candidatus Liptonbacteria bacterium]